MIARRLGASVSAVRRWESLGLLTPIRGEDGWAVYFADDEVNRLAERFGRDKPTTIKQRRRRHDSPAPKVSGRAAARVFELCRLNRTFQEIVIETRYPADTVRNAMREYQLGLDGPEKERLRREEEAEQIRLQREHDRKNALEERARQRVENKASLARKLLKEGMPPPEVARVLGPPPKPELPAPTTEEEKTG